MNDESLESEELQAARQRLEELYGIVGHGLPYVNPTIGERDRRFPIGFYDVSRLPQSEEGQPDEQALADFAQALVSAAQARAALIHELKDLEELVARLEEEE